MKDNSVIPQRDKLKNVTLHVTYAASGKGRQGGLLKQGNKVKITFDKRGIVNPQSYNASRLFTAYFSTHVKEKACEASETYTRVGKSSVLRWRPDLSRFYLRVQRWNKNTSKQRTVNSLQYKIHSRGSVFSFKSFKDEYML